MRLHQICKTKYLLYGGKELSAAASIGLAMATTMGLLSLFSLGSLARSNWERREWRALKNHGKAIGASAARYADKEFVKKRESDFTV